jgi:hypothetical protein
VYVNALIGGDINRSHHIVWLNGEFATASINEDCQLDSLGSTIIEQGVECGAYRTASIQYVVNEYNHTPIKCDGDAAWPNSRIGHGRGRIISIQCNIHMS